MSKTGTEIIEHYRGSGRTDASGIITSGSGTIEFPPVPAGFEWQVMMVTVTADLPTQPAGMVAAAYINSAQHPEALVGWDIIVSPAPGIVLEGYQPTIIRGGERLVVAVSSGGSATSARARVTYRLVEPDTQGWPKPADVRIVAWGDPQVVDSVLWTDSPTEG